MRSSTFHDRREAGRLLAARLQEMEIDEPVVIGLPRGGVPVAYEVAVALGATLDIGLVRKLGHPEQPELGLGAIGEDGVVVIDERAMDACGVSWTRIEPVIRREEAELARRRRLYRHHEAPVDVLERTAIIVDDGLATGSTAAAASRVLAARGARRIILAVPVCPAGTAERIDGVIDEVVALHTPARFSSVGAWYQDFSQTTDAEVIELLAAARSARSVPIDPAAENSGEVSIPARDGALLEGTLRLPPDPVGLVVFAHGSGSSRHSPRNVAVADYLEERGFATLLFDLLTPSEANDRRNVFDIELLTRRLVDAARWSRLQPALGDLPLACFGASTGAAAALRAAAELGDEVAAVVSRGGRADLAGSALPRVIAPTLLIVGGEDSEVLALNRSAAALMKAPCHLAVVPGAGHLFEEPGTLAQVAGLAADFLKAQMTAPAGPSRAARVGDR